MQQNIVNVLKIDDDNLNEELKSWKSFNEAEIKARRKSKIFKTLFPNRKRPGDFDIAQFLQNKGSIKSRIQSANRKLDYKQHNARKTQIQELDPLNLAKIKYKQVFLDVARHYIDSNQQSNSAGTASANEDEISTEQREAPGAFKPPSTNAIKQELAKVIENVETNPWLVSENRSKEFVSALTMELANRYANLKLLLSSQLSPAQNQQFVIAIFEMVDDLVTTLLEELQADKLLMDKETKFFGQILWDRLLAKFRSKLHKKLARESTIQNVLNSIVNGNPKLPSWAAFTNPDYLKAQIQSINTELGQITNVKQPVLEKPTIKSNHATKTADFIRQALIRNNPNAAKLSAVAAQQALLQLSNAKYSSNEASAQLQSDPAAGSLPELTTSWSSYPPSINSTNAAPLIDKKRLLLLAHSELGGGTRSPRRRWPLPPLNGHSEVTEPLEQAPPPIPKVQIAAATNPKYLIARGEKEEALKNIKAPSIDTAVKQDSSEYFTMPLNTREANDVDFGSQYKCAVRIPHSRPTPHKVPDLISVEKQQPAPLFEIRGAEDCLELDERIARQREIEELFDDIMKTLETDQWEQRVGNGRSDFVPDCPTAPQETYLSLAYKGLLISEDMAHTVFEDNDTNKDGPEEYQKLISRPSSAASMGPNGISRPQIRLLTRSESAGALDAAIYSIDRKTAMKLTPSSKYNTFKYNYGGYIPKWTGKLKTKQSKNLKRFLKKTGGIDIGARMSIKDYKRHLRIWATDKVRALVDAEQTEEEKRRLAKLAADEEMRKLKQAELRKVWEARKQRLAKKYALSRFHRQQWNAGILQYMDELAVSTDRESAIANQVENNERAFGESYTTAVGSDYNEKILAQFNNTMSQFRSQDPEAGEPGELSASKKLVFVSETALPVVSIQQDLEKIWNMLGMPEHQRVQMATKWAQSNYWAAKSKQFQSLAAATAAASAQANAARPSSSLLETNVMLISSSSEETSTKVREALTLYKQAAEAVLRREQVVKQLANFESFASNPERYFARGFQGSSSARLIEAGERAIILKELKSADEQVRLFTRRIKRKLHETLSFNGQPYHEKMRRDIPEIFYRLENDRRALKESRKLLLSAKLDQRAPSASHSDHATREKLKDEQIEAQWETDNEESISERATTATSRPVPRELEANSTEAGILAYLARNQHVKFNTGSRAQSAKNIISKTVEKSDS